MIQRRAFLSIAAAAPLVALAGPALADGTDDSLAKVKKAREGLKTLVAKFKQVRRIGLLADEVKSEGELTLVMPDKLRWELFAPDDIVYWVTPSGVAYKSKGKKAAEAPAGAFGTLLPDMIKFLGGDMAGLKSHYDMEAKDESDGAVSIVAKPKVDEIKKHLKKLTMRTNADRWGIARVVIEEPKGDSSTIDFMTNQRNVDVPADKMDPKK